MKPLAEGLPMAIVLVLVVLGQVNLARSESPAATGAAPTRAGDTAQLRSESPLRFETITTKDGLSHPSVYSILQDRWGFLWFATKYGLNKFDGVDFTVFTHDSEDPSSISENYVWNLLEDRDGALWIATWGGGLDRFDPATASFTHFRNESDRPQSLSGNSVWALFEDSRGTLWIGTEGAGLNRFDRSTETFTRFMHDPGDPNTISHNTVTSVCEDREGFLWIGTFGGGLNRYDPRTGTFLRFLNRDGVSNSLSHDQVWTVFVDHFNDLWIGTQSGLNRLDPASLSKETIRYRGFVRYAHDPGDADSLSHNRVRAIHEDDEGRLWVGTTGGLNRYDRESGTFRSYRFSNEDPESLGHDSVYALATDSNGGLWIGTANGVSKADRGSQRFELYFRNHQVHSIYEDDTGVIWIGAGGDGLHCFDRVRNQEVRCGSDRPGSMNLSGGIVSRILPDTDGWLWIATQDGGLDHCDPETGNCRRYQREADGENQSGDDTIMDLALGPDGAVWTAVANRGLDRFDPKTRTFTTYLHDSKTSNSLVSDFSRTVFVDSRGMVWIGTDGEGLSRFEPHSGRFERYQAGGDEPNSLSNNTVNMVHEDRDGTIWVATNDGLNRFDVSTGSFTVPRDGGGLPANSIAGILEDDQGNLWLSTSKGVSKYVPATGRVRNFDEQDGLQSSQFLYHAAYKSRSGELFFGGLDGLNSFQPEEFVDNPIIPPVVLTDFKIFNESVPVGNGSPLSRQIGFTDRITLAPNQSVFSIEFAALNYRAPEKNRYAYFLEGFDRDWTAADSSQRTAKYTNLDPGQYVFQVKASNNDGLWNEEGTRLTIEITPAFWDSWLFRGLMLLLLIAVVIAGIRVKTIAIKRQNRRLEAEVAVRTNDLEQSNDQLKLEIRKRRKIESELHELAITDPLTGMFNRRHFFDLSQREFARARRYQRFFSLILMDLDHFKMINDEHGHLCGDRVLKITAECIRQHTRDIDIHGRYGGDEFVILLPETPHPNAIVFAERLCETIPLKLDSQNEKGCGSVTLSMGIAHFSGEPELTLDSLIERADQALYAVKRRGGNGVRVWQEG